jgi:hypothetical protein
VIEAWTRQNSRLLVGGDFAKNAVVLGPADLARRHRPADSVDRFQLRQERVGNRLDKLLCDLDDEIRHVRPNLVVVWENGR